MSTSDALRVASEAHTNLLKDVRSQFSELLLLRKLIAARRASGGNPEEEAAARRREIRTAVESLPLPSSPGDVGAALKVQSLSSLSVLCFSRLCLLLHSADTVLDLL